MILSHRGRVTHISIGDLTITASDNGLSPDRCQAIISTNAGILLIGPLGTNFREILMEIHTFSFKQMHLKRSSAKWWLFCLYLNVLKVHGTDDKYWNYPTFYVIYTRGFTWAFFYHRSCIFLEWRCWRNEFKQSNKLTLSTSAVILSVWIGQDSSPRFCWSSAMNIANLRKRRRLSERGMSFIWDHRIVPGHFCLYISKQVLSQWEKSWHNVTY